MNYTGTKIENNLTVPSVVSSSVGKYNSTYVGVASATSTMTLATSYTNGSTYYAVYRSSVKIYYPSSKTVVTDMTKYRNEYFTSTSAMSTVLADSTTGTTDFSFSSSVSGYSLYGFATTANTTTRTYSSIAGLRDSSTVTAYAILYKASGSNTYYIYCTSTTTAKCTEPDPLTPDQLGEVGEIGKYVNYVPAGSNYTVNGVYSGTGSNQMFPANNSMKWRIWGVEGNKLLLISETLVGNITLQGENGYNNVVKILNDACSTAFGNSSTYGSGAIVARSINQDDIDKVTNMTADIDRKAQYPEYGTKYKPYYTQCPIIYGYEPGKVGGGGKLDRSVQYNNNSWAIGLSTFTSATFTDYGGSITGKATQKIYDALLTNPTASSSIGMDTHNTYWVATRVVYFRVDQVVFGAFTVHER